MQPHTNERTFGIHLAMTIPLKGRSAAGDEIRAWTTTGSMHQQKFPRPNTPRSGLPISDLHEWMDLDKQNWLAPSQLHLRNKIGDLDLALRFPRNRPLDLNASSE